MDDTMSSEVLKVEELEACCVCGVQSEELCSPEEHDAGAAPGAAPLRTVLLHLNNNKVVPNGRLCSNCIRRALDAYSFSTALASKGPPPLSEKIRALRKRLHELTQKIDVFIVVGGGSAAGAGAAGGAYSEEDIIMVERGALEAAARADAAGAERGLDARGAAVYQCTVCPLSFDRVSSYRAHCAAHAPGAPHSCWACGARLPSAAALREHELLHAPRPLHCHLCDTTFPSGGELRAHEARCPAACPECASAFPSRPALRAHCASHATLCPECFAPCGSGAARAAHVLQHRRDRHFVCGYRACILRFPARADLMAHIRKCHAGEDAAPPAPPPPARGAVPCAHCPRTFGSAPAMKRHARTHPARPDAQDMDWAEAEKVEYLEVEALDEPEQDAA